MKQNYKEQRKLQKQQQKLLQKQEQEKKKLENLQKKQLKKKEQETKKQNKNVSPKDLKEENKSPIFNDAKKSLEEQQPGDFVYKVDEASGCEIVAKMVNSNFQCGHAEFDINNE